LYEATKEILKVITSKCHLKKLESANETVRDVQRMCRRNLQINDYSRKERITDLKRSGVGVHEWTAMSSRISLGSWARKGGHRQRPGDIG